MNKELKYLLEEMKDTTQDYIGTNGCKYQDLLREELNLILSYVEELQTTVNDCKQEKENFRKLKEKYQLKKEIYKSRNEKAIEYCENNKEYTPRLIDVIDILKGGGEECSTK